MQNIRTHFWFGTCFQEISTRLKSIHYHVYTCTCRYINTAIMCGTYKWRSGYSVRVLSYKTVYTVHLEQPTVHACTSYSRYTQIASSHVWHFFPIATWIKDIMKIVCTYHWTHLTLLVFANRRVRPLRFFYQTHPSFEALVQTVTGHCRAYECVYPPAKWASDKFINVWSNIVSQILQNFIPSTGRFGHSIPKYGTQLSVWACMHLHQMLIGTITKLCLPTSVVYMYMCRCFRRRSHHFIHLHGYLYFVVTILCGLFKHFLYLIEAPRPLLFA